MPCPFSANIPRLCHERTVVNNAGTKNENSADRTAINQELFVEGESASSQSESESEDEDDIFDMGGKSGVKRGPYKCGTVCNDVSLKHMNIK
jgi:hypothetical protein